MIICIHVPMQAVLVSVPDLECGFSRDLFVQWASNPRNSIILTSRPASGCLARDLIDNLKINSIELEVGNCRKKWCKKFMPIISIIILLCTRSTPIL